MTDDTLLQIVWFVGNLILTAIGCKGVHTYIQHIKGKKPKSE